MEATTLSESAHQTPLPRSLGKTNWTSRLSVISNTLLLTFFLCCQPSLATTAPTFSVSQGVYSTAQTLTITADPGATIHYTTDGSTPTGSSPTYTSPISVTVTEQINAIAILSGVSSTVSSDFIQIDALTVNLPRTNLMSWWKADFLPAGSKSGSSIAEWYDASGSGNNFAETGTAQPGWNATAANGLPSLTFSGSQYLFASGLSTNSFPGYSVFIVAKPTTITNQARLIDFGQGEATNNIAVSELTSPSGAFNFLSYNGTTASNLSTAAGFFSTSSFVLAEGFQSGSSTAYIYKNGVLNTSGALSNVNNVTRTYNYIGSDHNLNHQFTGDIAEILVYNSQLSQPAQQEIEGYLFARYGLGIHQPTITPGGASSTENYAVSSGPQTVTITTPDPGASIYYTLDGSTPSNTSTPYTGPFMLSSGSTTVKAISYLGSLNSMAVPSKIQIDPNSALVTRTGLYGWYKADLGITASAVSDWPDVSGNAHDLTQATTAKQPSWTSNVVYGLPAVLFNGTSDYLQFPSIASSFTSGATVFMVCEPSDLTAGRTLFSFGTSTTSNTKAITSYINTNGTTGGIEYQVFGATSPGVLTPGSTAALNTWGEVDILHDSSNTGWIYTNGVQKATGSLIAIPSTAWPYGYIGLAQELNGFWEGRISEILVYQQPLTTAQRQNVEAYLTGRYGLAPHPPIISPTNFTAPGTWPVTISGDPGTTIRYTLDGSNPTSSSPIYTGGFNVTTTTTIKAAEFGEYANSSISTSVIQIDPATTGVPAGVGSGLQIWLKADQGPQISSGTNVTTWSDMSGNLNDANQGTLAHEPNLVTGALNGLPVVQFNASLSDFMSFPSTLQAFSGGNSVFAVVGPTPLSSSDTFVSFGTSPSHAYNGLSLSVYNTSGAFSYNTYNSVGTLTPLLSANGILSAGSYNLLEARQDTVYNPCWIYNNGNFLAQLGTNQPIGSGAWTYGFVGCGQANTGYLHGNIAEMLLYNRPVNSVERAEIENYLLNRYALLTALPTAPTFSPVAGALSGPTQVAIDAPYGSTIHFTVDGSTPSLTSPVYSQPVLVTYSETIKAIAVLDGVSSSVSSSAYTLNSSTSPAPSATDPATLNIDLQLPATAIPN